MSSGSQVARHWLAIIPLTALSHWLVCNCNLAAGVTMDGEGLKKANSMNQTSDPYWQYYEACDRWGVQFANLTADLDEPGPKVATELERPSSRRVAIQSIGYVKPRARSGFQRNALNREIRTEFFRSLVQRSIRPVEQASLQLQSIAFRAYQLIHPSLNQLEFANVENATYPQFFLLQKDSGIRSAIRGMGQRTKVSILLARSQLAGLITKISPFAIVSAKEIRVKLGKLHALLQNNTILIRQSMDQ